LATYSPFPVFIDGVRLDSAAWGIESKIRTIAGSRNADVVIPGVDGVAASVNDDIDATTMSLNMWVLGTDENGLIPASGMATCRANVDQLAFLFGKQHTLISVSEVVDDSGSQRQAYAKVSDSISPEIRAGGLGKFVVSLTIPEGLWQDASTPDWTQSGVTASTVYEVSTLQGSTAPISDATILVTGPVTNPQVNDITGAYVRFNGALAAGQSWRVNCATWATRYGTGLTLGSLDTAGTDAQAQTVYGGGNARFLRLVPTLSAGLRRVQVSVTGTGMTGATALAIRGRRKFRQ
jgi:hypothetical protein